MDGSRLDSVARALASRFSRRTAIRSSSGLAAVVAAGAVARPGRAQDATPLPGDVRVRPNAKNLDPIQKTAFVDAVLALKRKPSPWDEGLSVYDSFVLWHRDAFSCQINAAHMAPAFLPWHRQYLLLFEEQLRSVDPTVNLPYWDWTVDNQKDSYVWQDDLMGGDGDPTTPDHAVTTGPFKQGSWELVIFDYNDTTKAPYLIRDLGAGDLGPTLPTADEVEAALNVPTYDAAPWNSLSPIAESFRNTLEGWRDCVQQLCDPLAGIAPVCTGSHDIHNRVHLWVAGEFQMSHEQTMEGHAGMATPVAAPNTPAGSVTILGTMAANSSVNDPVFYLHHTNLDRLWNEWLRRHGQVYQPESGGPLGHNIDDQMWPYDQLGIVATPRMMLDSRALGYVYDTD